MSENIEKHFARVFAGVSGMAVLEHLQRMTFGRVLGPHATDAELRMAEGARALVRHIETMVSRGRAE